MKARREIASAQHFFFHLKHNSGTAKGLLENATTRAALRLFPPNETRFAFL
jgi:hypothetical protein